MVATAVQIRALVTTSIAQAVAAVAERSSREETERRMERLTAPAPAAIYAVEAEGGQLYSISGHTLPTPTAMTEPALAAAGAAVRWTLSGWREVSMAMAETAPTAV